MAQWYFAHDNQRFGPFGDADALRRAAENPDMFAWREGFADWVPVRSIAELSGATPPAGTVGAPPPPRGTPRTADAIDYRIVGSEMQFVEVELDPGESAVAEAGTMMYKDATVIMETVFGDGSRPTGGGGGFMDKLLGAGKRILTGESLFMTVFAHQAAPGGRSKARVAFAAPYPGNIIPVALPSVGGRLICQKDSFLCAARGVSIGIFFQKRILTGLFGGEGFIMQKLEGDGMVFMHAGGTVVERELGPGETLHVDTGCLVAMMDSVSFDIQQVGGIKSMLFGGEGVFFANLRGPGRVWLQSLPFSRLAGRMLASAPRAGGGRREEGSILGALGGLVDGDNS